MLRHQLLQAGLVVWIGMVLFMVMGEVKLHSSKLKITGIIAGSLLFVIAGVILFVYAKEITSEGKLIGILSIIFFGFSGILGIFMLFDMRPILTLNNDGIKLVSIGYFNRKMKKFIPWQDVEFVTKFNFSIIIRGARALQKGLAIKLKNPEQYTSIIGKDIEKMIVQNFDVELDVDADIMIPSSLFKKNIEEILEIFSTYPVEVRK